MTGVQTCALPILQFNREALAQQQQNIQPWLNAGTGALNTIGQMVNDPGFNFTQEFKPPTQEEIASDPMIQFQLDRGQKQLDAYLRSKGLSMSGKAIKEINEFAQGVASQSSQRVFQNKLTEYETAYNRFANERSARLNPLMSIAGLGQTSVGQLNSAQQNAANTAGDITLGTAARTADATTSAAASRASGYAAGGNIWGNVLGNVGNQILDSATMRDLMRRLPIQSVGTA